MIDSLIKKIKNKEIVIGIIGLGYVGLPLALAFSEHVRVIGYDIDFQKIRKINSGLSPISDISDDYLNLYLNHSFYPVHDPSLLTESDILIITVQTPLNSDKTPNLDFIVNAGKIVKNFIAPGKFVILESTTYPGTTEEILIPILESGGLVAGKDFGVAYSPERVDPGNKEYTIKNMPKIVGGINKVCTEIAADIYSIFIVDIVKVSDCRTAETVKMVENIFRNVNIALVNEFTLILERMKIDVWEVLHAAATKPFGFMPFYPGPGIGGHCIPLDPHYLVYQAKKYGIIPQLIERSIEINNFMPHHAINLIEKGLHYFDQRIPGSNIAILGLAYKKNIDDIRESPSITIINTLLSMGAHLKLFDPYINQISTDCGLLICQENIYQTFNDVDCGVFLVDHDQFKELKLTRIKNVMKNPLIIDCKNIFNPIDGFIYIGLGKPEQMRYNTSKVFDES
jgi:UDP-N-acetyl-D-glucosamine dehydrogenase